MSVSKYEYQTCAYKHTLHRICVVDSRDRFAEGDLGSAPSNKGNEPARDA
jgi:hypothetical protein